MLRSTLIYAPAILLTRISALLLLVIATRLIDQTEYGFLTLVVTVGELTDSALTSWLRIALLRLGGKGEISRGSLLLAARVLGARTSELERDSRGPDPRLGATLGGGSVAL